MSAVPPGRVAVIFHRFGPYHVARLAATGRGGPVTAIELSGLSREYAWDAVPGADGFRRVTLFPDSDAVAPAVLTEKLVATLAAEKPEVVFVNGWSGAVPAAAVRWCLNEGVPAVVMSASTALDEKRQWWKEAVKRKVVGCFSAALVGGIRQAEYAIALGVPAERVFPGYDVVDNDHFAAGADAVRADPGARARLGVPERFFLSCTRFVAKKNLPMLIRAFAAYRKQAGAEPWDLVLLGDGELRPALKQQIRDSGLSGSVHLPGFRQYPELPSFYGLAKAFVLASTSEQWGLVVNEAMAAQLPVLVSNLCGCAPDLVRPGETGFSFDPSNEAELVGLMTRVAGDPAGAARMGQAARAHVDNYSTATFAAALWQAAAAARSAPRPRPGLAARTVLSALSRR